MKPFQFTTRTYWVYAFIVTLLCSIAGYHYLTGYSPALMSILFGILGFLSYLMMSVILLKISPFVKKIQYSRLIIHIAFIVVIILLRKINFRLPETALWGLLGISLILGISIDYFSSKFRQKRLLSYTSIYFVLPISLTIWSIYFVSSEGFDTTEEFSAFQYYHEEDYATTDATTLTTNKIAPLQKGNYAVSTFTYGSGNDRNRPEYNQSVKWVTDPVDGSLILPEWDSIKQKSRQDFLGFGVENFPLNARVYLPEDDLETSGNQSPYPLFLIVHGNHAMIDWSDAGYDYIGNHLASRGIIVVSVDENFLNSHHSGDFRGKEMPARGWLLLKHLELWRKWNEDPNHELYGKVDLNKIILAGHSRGGEAVQIAAVFNQLQRFPENGNMEFDFDFNLKGIISIAPTDYRYKRQVSMKNINYLTLQGSYDSDESSFWGMRAFRRLSFDDSLYWFKSGVYIHRANHSQFNSTWGNSDTGVPYSWFLNEGSLISGNKQREIALFYITAFAEKVNGKATVTDEVFKNIKTVRKQLPDSYILTHFEDSNTKTIIDFGEDANIDNGPDGVKLKGNNLVIWEESDLKSRDKQSLQNYAVKLGWYNHENSAVVPSYSIHIDSGYFKNEIKEIIVTMGPGNYKNVKRHLHDSIKLESPEYNFEMIFTDDNNERVTIKIDDIKKLAPQLFSEFGKLSSMNEDLGKWEVQTETFHIGLEVLKKKNNKFNLRQLQSISFDFGKIIAGEMIIDKISYSIHDN